MGLGFDKGASEAQLNTLSNLKDMKDKYKQQGDKKDNKSAVKPQKFTPELSRSALSKKVGQKSAHDEILEKRKAKLQHKLDSRQKAKDSKEAAAAEEEEKPLELEKPKHFLKRNLKKTRSRQKNKRKDNRP